MSARGQPDEPVTTLSAEDERTLELNAKGMRAAMVGWFICAFFASVAFNWTFYYVLALAVGGREIAAAHRLRATAAAPAPTAQFVEAHA